MSNKDLVARARAMLKADDVDTKDMLAMVGELADAVERVPCVVANRCAALEAKPAVVKESLTTPAAQPAQEGKNNG